MESRRTFPLFFLDKLFYLTQEKILDFPFVTGEDTMQNQLCWWTSYIHSRVARILGQLSKEFRWKEPVWICSSSLLTMPRHSPKSVSSTHSRSKQRSQLSTNQQKGARVFWLTQKMQGTYEVGRVYTTSPIRAPNPGLGRSVWSRGARVKTGKANVLPFTILPRIGCGFVLKPF